MGKKGGCCTCWREEFTKKNFLLDHDRPQILGQPQCGRYTVVYLVYRVLVALFFTGVTIYSGTQSTVKWLIYLTNWSFLMIAINTILQLLCVAIYLGKSKTSMAVSETLYTRNPALFRISWVFNNIVLGSAPLVTIAYWALLYDGSSPNLGFLNLTTHAVNSIYVVVDMIVSGFPVRWLHFFHVVIYGVVYMLFTVIYWAAGGTDPNGNPWVYPILDYGGNPGIAVGYILGLTLVGAMLVHTLMYGLYRLRLVVYSVKQPSLRQTAMSQENILGSKQDMTSSMTSVLPETSVYL